MKRCTARVCIVVGGLSRFTREPTWRAREHRAAFPRGGMSELKTNYLTQARFQQKQLQEKEQKLLQLYDQQQQRAYQVVQRGSAGSNASSNQGSVRTTAAMTTTTTTTTSTSQGGKVSDFRAFLTRKTKHTSSSSHVESRLSRLSRFIRDGNGDGSRGRWAHTVAYWDKIKDSICQPITTLRTNSRETIVVTNERTVMLSGQNYILLFHEINRSRQDDFKFSRAWCKPERYWLFLQFLLSSM